MAPQAACPAHTLPSEAQCPSGLGTLCPPSAAPTPSNRDQFLKTERYYLRGRRDYPRGRRVPPSAHADRAHSLGPASVPAGEPHIPTLGRCPQHGHGPPAPCGVTSKHQSCGSNPAPSHPEPILSAPGLGAGHGATPTVLEKQVFPVPLGSSEVERGRWSLFLCGIAPRARESCTGTCTGEVTTQCPQVKCQAVPVPNPSLVAGPQHPPWVQQCRGWGGEQDFGTLSPAPGPWHPPGDTQGPQCHHSSCLNSPVPAAHVGFQIKSGATLLFLRKGAGLCRTGWPSCCSPNAWGDPGSCLSAGPWLVPQGGRAMGLGHCPAASASCSPAGARRMHGASPLPQGEG